MAESEKKIMNMMDNLDDRMRSLKTKIHNFKCAQRRRSGDRNVNMPP